MSPYRDPGRVDPPAMPADWKPCARCKGWLSPWHNARRTAAGIVCIPCFEELSK